jgi:hypothetical protein
LENHAFPAAPAGYEDGTVPPLAVTVVNTGSQPTGQLDILLSGEDIENFSLSASSLNIGAGENAAFTVTPKAGLAPGTYTAIVTLTRNSSTMATVSLSFTVNPQDSGNIGGDGSGNGGGGSGGCDAGSGGVAALLCAGLATLKKRRSKLHAPGKPRLS